MIICIFFGLITFCQSTNHHFVIHDEIIQQIWNGENPINYSQPRYIDKGYPHTNINPILVKAILNYVKPQFWLEVGSMLGGSAIRTANVMKELDMNTSLVCVDPFTGRNIEIIATHEFINSIAVGDVNMLAREQSLADHNRWRFVRNEKGQPTIYERFRANVMAAQHQDRIIPILATSTVGMKLIMLLKVENRISLLPEVIFLDSAHEEVETLAELHLAWSLLSPGGILMGDDFNWPGVSIDVIKFANHLRQTKKHNLQRTKEFKALLRGSIYEEKSGNDTIILLKYLWVLVK